MTDVAARIREAIDNGCNVDALDLARAASHGDSCDAEVCYLGALANARMGAIVEAEQWLARIDRARLDTGAFAAELWALSGRIAKDRFVAARQSGRTDAAAAAGEAMRRYRRAFEIAGTPYPAVNAATMAALVGDFEVARGLAQVALGRLGAVLDHWGHASAGEAHLVLGNLGEARAHYAQAHRLAGSRFGDIASMRRQLTLIGSPEARALLDAIPAPRVLAFSGHMIDGPGRATPRFPAHLETKVARAIREELAALGPAIGYAQAACGADILFLEALQDGGMQTNVVLPFAKSDYVAESVGFAGEGWIERFERALARATRVTLATDEPFLGDEVLFEHAANLLQGMAFLRASELSTDPLMLTVHDAGSPHLIGGTASTATLWSRWGRQVRNIDLAALRGTAPQVAGGVTALHAAEPPARAAPPRSLQSLLFADVAGFSKIPEQYTPEFAQLFLGTCKRLLDMPECRAIDVNTRGDGLFAVFARPRQAAEFAVRLQSAMREVDWTALGMSPQTSLRIALHVGPVFRTFDPVMGKTTFYGTHVNRTAHLEPIVQPGQIFVTEAFAASLVPDDGARFHCHYIGAVPLAKHVGDASLYRLTPANVEG